MNAHQTSVTLTILLVVAAVLVVFRLQLPSLVKDYLNDQLADMGDYHGKVAEVDIHLWRGAYSVTDLQITNKAQPQTVFFQADLIDTSVSWSALFKGKIVADVALVRAEMHLVDDGTEKQQPAEKSTWRQTVQEILPLQIDRLDIEDSKIHFHNFTSNPPVHIVFSQLNGEITNLSNANRNSGPEFADFALHGLLFDNANASLNGQLDPLGDFHNFDINLKVTGIDLLKLNNFAEAYGNFNFKSGNGDFVMELQADNAQLTGYAKPILDNVEIFDLEKDLQQGVFSAAWQAVVGAFGQLFRNTPKDRIASQIEIRGNLDDPEMSAWQAFIAILRNAFVDAFDNDFGRESPPTAEPTSAPSPDTAAEPDPVDCSLAPIWQPCE